MAMKSKILIVSVSVLLLAGLCGVYLLNKPHRSIDGLSTIKVTAEILTQAFEIDEANANNLYLNRALTVTGVASEVDQNEQKQQVVLLKGPDDLSGVFCTLKEKNNALKVGDFIKISGFCNGYTTVVILDDCKILE